MPTLEVTLKGRVQGVFFRAFTKSFVDKYNLNAPANQITGVIQNLADGDLKVIFTSDDAGIDTLIPFLLKGPPNAIVKTMKIDILEETISFTSFRILN